MSLPTDRTCNADTSSGMNRHFVGATQTLRRRSDSELNEVTKEKSPLDSFRSI